LQTLLDAITVENDAVSAMLEDLASERLIPLPEPETPPQFPSYDDDISTDYCCPQCGYEWSGQQK